MVKGFDRVADRSDLWLTGYYGVGNITIKRLRLIHETGCTIEEAIDQVYAKPNQVTNKVKQWVDPADQPMHRPDGVNWLTRAWG